MIQSSSRRKTLPSYFYTLSLRHPSSSSTLISSSDSLSSSGSSSSSIGTNSTLIPSEQDEDEEYEDEEIYVPHLHNRLKQQPKQAILTTLDDFKIIITNSTASDVLVGHENYQQDQLIGKQVIMDLIDPSYQNRLNSIIVKQRKTVMQKSNDSINADDGTVIICGDIVRQK